MCFFHRYKVAFTVRVSTETIFFIDFIKDSEIGKCWLPYISYRIIFREGSVCVGEGRVLFWYEKYRFPFDVTSCFMSDDVLLFYMETWSVVLMF